MLKGHFILGGRNIHGLGPHLGARSGSKNMGMWSLC